MITIPGIKMAGEKLKRGEYSIYRDNIKDIVTFDISGYLDNEGLPEFMRDYANIVKVSNPQKTSLILEVTHLKAFPSTVEMDLQKLYNLYSKNFKKIYIIKSVETCTDIQMHRVQKKAGVTDSFEYFDNLSNINL